MGIINTVQALTRREALGPFTLLLIINISPWTKPEYSFVLLGQGGWSFGVFNLTTSISMLCAYVIIMSVVTRIGKWFKYNIILTAAQILFSMYLVATCSVIFSDKFGEGEYAVFYTIANCSWALSKSLTFVMIIGRISKFLPQGFESTGVTIVVACSNFTISVGQYLGSILLQYYEVRAGYYERLEGPQVVVLGLSILVVAACPLFLPC